MNYPVLRASSLPDWLKVLWLCCSPVALLFSARIAWEKTVWTWTRGPQMVGFSLMHTDPLFAIVGGLFAFGLMVWLVPAVVFLIMRRRNITWPDVAMVGTGAFVTATILLPDTFFA